MRAIRKFDNTARCLAIWDNVFVAGSTDGKIAVWDLTFAPLPHRRKTDLTKQSFFVGNEDEDRIMSLSSGVRVGADGSVSAAEPAKPGVPGGDDVDIDSDDSEGETTMGRRRKKKGHVDLAFLAGNRRYGQGQLAVVACLCPGCCVVTPYISCHGVRWSRTSSAVIAASVRHSDAACHVGLQRQPAAGV